MAKSDFLTPVGRLVQGDPFEAQTKNQQGQPLVTMSGQPTQRYFIAVAFKKDDPQFPAFYQKLVEVARQSWPQHFNAQGQCVHPRFSMKLIDGDGVDDNGRQNNTKEGFAGHWVVKFQSSFAPRCFHAGHYAPHEQIQDPNAIKRGYFVRVAGTVEGNTNVQKPGIYVNLGMVELALARPDLIISSGPDANSVFGGGAPLAPAPVGAALPTPGGFAPPAAPSLPSPGAPMGAPSLPGMPAAPVAPAAAPGMPAMPGMPAAPGSVAVPPNPAFLNGPGGTPALPAAPGMPPAPLAPPAPPAPVAYQMTAAAQGFTRDQYVAQGWTDAALRAAGMML